MTVDKSTLALRQRGQKTRVVKRDCMRWTIAGYALLMFNGFQYLRSYILEQRSASGDIQRLHAETDRKQRHATPLDFFKNQQICFIFNGMHAAQIRVLLRTVAHRVDIGIAAGQQYPVETTDYSGDIIRPWYQTDVHGRDTCRYYGLAVVTRKVKAIRPQLKPHCYADARAASSDRFCFFGVFHHSLRIHALHLKLS